MPIPTTLRRSLAVAAASVAGVVLAASPAFAHHCFVPMYSLRGPQSANWLVFSAEQGAEMEAGYTAQCRAAADAGYAALRAEGLPVGIKIMVTKTIGDPKDEGKMAGNPANNKGLEYFGGGSELPMLMVMTYIEGASSVTC